MMKSIFTIALSCISLLLSLNLSTAQATTIDVKNNSGQTVTLTDFISFTNANNTGASTVHMKKKDAADDIGIAVGGTKKFDVGTHKSWTVSWNNSSGTEVETDTTNTVVPITAQQLAMFDSNFGGFYDIEYDFAAIGALPNVGSTFLIDTFGHPIGSGLDWITLFDVTQSITGFIERDAIGNPISPLLPVGTEVTASFLWSITAVPEPSIMSLVGLGLGALIVTQRRKAGRAGKRQAFPTIND